MDGNGSSDGSSEADAPDEELTEDYMMGYGAVEDYAPPDTDPERSNQPERDAYWDARRDANKGAYPWDFYTDPDNLLDLGRGLLSVATPMAFKAIGALFGGNLGPDADQTPAPSDVPGAYSDGGGPRMTRVAAVKPKKAGKAVTALAADTSDQPRRTATGTPRAGILANVETTPYGLLGDAPVTRKILMGT